MKARSLAQIAVAVETIAPLYNIISMQDSCFGIELVVEHGDSASAPETLTFDTTSELKALLEALR